MPEKRLTTLEMDAFIREHHKGTGHKAMADLVNEHFGTSFTGEQMKAYYSRNKLDSGLTGRFVKGQEPPNKGKSWDEYMSKDAQRRSRKTTFKKGHVPHNGGTPIGELRLRKAVKNKPGSHAYYYEKVEQPNVWRLKHQLEWEKHNGPIPSGCMVVFADGDTTNWHIENLLLETKAQHAIKNRHHIHGNDLESGEVANAMADLKMATNKAIARQKKIRKPKRKGRRRNGDMGI